VQIQLTERRRETVRILHDDRPRMIADKLQPVGRHRRTRQHRREHPRRMHPFHRNALLPDDGDRRRVRGESSDDDPSRRAVVIALVSARQVAAQQVVRIKMTSRHQPPDRAEHRVVEGIHRSPPSDPSAIR
jgi:hypothetical protein